MKHNSASAAKKLHEVSENTSTIMMDCWLSDRHTSVWETGQRSVWFGDVQNRSSTGDCSASIPVRSYTSDFQHSCGSSWHSEKDFAVVGCVSDGQEDEHRVLVDDSVEWCGNHLVLNANEKRELATDFRRNRLRSMLGTMLMWWRNTSTWASM